LKYKGCLGQVKSSFKNQVGFGEQTTSTMQL